LPKKYRRPRDERLVLRGRGSWTLKRLPDRDDRRIAEKHARIPTRIGLTMPKAGSLARTRSPAKRLPDRAADGTVIGGCGFDPHDGTVPEDRYWLGTRYWARATPPRRCVALMITPSAILSKGVAVVGARHEPGIAPGAGECGFQWTGVGLCRIRALGSSVPVDRFRLELGIWVGQELGPDEARGITH